ncbi:hypothetical protein KY285_026586 [Solanum tuberosum]|nr:hypothetical protein KY285_026586 [Solanum tuberosum]
MEDDIEAYVKTCHVCQVDKTERKKEAGLLQPVPIPERPWLSVDGMASIMVVVDRFSKYSIFIVAPNLCSSEIAAELFYKYVVKYFGVPTHIVSGRDTRFTGRGMLEALCDSKSTELGYFIRHCAALLQSAQGKCPAAYMVARERLEVFSEEKDSLRIAQRRMRKYADQHRRSVEFSVSDKVLLKLSPQIMKQIVTKTRHWGLIPKYDGPFKVVKRMQMIRTGTDQRGILHQYLHSLMLRFRRSLITGLWAQFDDQIDDYLKIVSMRTSSSSGAGGLFNP